MFVCLFFGLEACRILTLRPGIESTIPAGEGKVLTTGPAGEPQGTLSRSMKHRIGFFFFSFRNDRGTRAQNVDTSIFFLIKIISGLMVSTEKSNGTPLQYSCLENPMDGGAWWAAVHGVAKSWTQLSNFTFTFHFPALEKEMATHSSVLSWRIPGMREPGGLLSMGSHRVGHS